MIDQNSPQGTLMELSSPIGSIRFLAAKGGLGAAKTWPMEFVHERLTASICSALTQPRG